MYAFAVAYGLYIKKEDSRPPFFHVPAWGDGLGRGHSRRLGAGVRDAWTRAALSEGPLIAILPAAGRGSATALLRRVAQVDGAFNRARLLQQLPASAVLRDDAERVGAVLQRRGHHENHLRGVVDG